MNTFDLNVEQDPGFKPSPSAWKAESSLRRNPALYVGQVAPRFRLVVPALSREFWSVHPDSNWNLNLGKV